MISGEVIFPLQMTFKKMQGRILEILVTALLESIDLFIAVFDAHDE